MKFHNIQYSQRRYTGSCNIKRCSDSGYYGEIFGNVICYAERCQCSPGHKQLLSCFYNFNKLSRVAIKINHVTCFACSLGTGIHRKANISLGKGRCIIGSITDHTYQVPICLLFPYPEEFVLGFCLSKKIVNPCFGSNGSCSLGIVTCYHNCTDTHHSKLCEPLFNTSLYNILEMYDTQNLVVFSNYQWCCSLT